MAPKYIVGSKWTALAVTNREKHFEVVSFNNKDKTVYLKPVFKGKSRKVSLYDLSDSTKWIKGWES